MLDECLDRMMKILEMMSEESAELLNRYKEHSEKLTEAEKRVEAMNQSLEATEKRLLKLGAGVNGLEKELLANVRELARKSERAYENVAEKEKFKRGFKRYVAYPVVLLLVLCAGILVSGRYYAPLAMEQYAELHRKAMWYDHRQEQMNKMTSKERETYNNLFEALEKRKAKP